MEPGAVNISGTECFPLAYATEAEIREFAASTCITSVKRTTWSPCGSAAPRRFALGDQVRRPVEGDILVKPASAPESVPLVIPGVNKWAAELFGGNEPGALGQAERGCAVAYSGMEGKGG